MNLREENGFGYDPIFYVPELGKTTAELSEEEKKCHQSQRESPQNDKGDL